MDLPENSKVIVLKNIPYFGALEYDLYDEKDFKKYIKDVESVVRKSNEYKRLIRFLKENGGFNACAIFKNVVSSPGSKIKIEAHHSPFTLYEIAMAVYNKRSYNNESLEVELVAKEVMYLHYFLIIGLIPLSELAHDLVHEQILTVHPDKVFGNWQEFYNLYEDFILEETKDKIEMLRGVRIQDMEAQNRHALRFNPTFVSMRTDNALVDENGDLKIEMVEAIENGIDVRSEILEKRRLGEEQERRNRSMVYDNQSPYDYSNASQGYNNDFGIVEEPEPEIERVIPFEFAEGFPH